MRTIPPTNCLTCGAVVRKKKYCTPECYYASLRGKISPRNTRVVLACERCGSEKPVKAYRKGMFRFCSNECYLEHHMESPTTPELERLRRSAAYKKWRTAVFIRDDYTCQECGQRGGKLHADHIKSFAYHPELRFELHNGRTLCVPCHRLTPNYGYKARLLGASA